MPTTSAGFSGNSAEELENLGIAAERVQAVDGARQDAQLQPEVTGAIGELERAHAEVGHVFQMSGEAAYRAVGGHGHRLSREVVRVPRENAGLLVERERLPFETLLRLVLRHPLAPKEIEQHHARAERELGALLGLLGDLGALADFAPLEQRLLGILEAGPPG
jgi:hypothetical protein